MWTTSVSPRSRSRIVGAAPAMALRRRRVVRTLGGILRSDGAEGPRRRLRRVENIGWENALIAEEEMLFRAQKSKPAKTPGDCAAQPRHVVLRIELSGCAIPPTAHRSSSSSNHHKCSFTTANRSPRARARSAIPLPSIATRSPQISTRNSPRSGGGPQRPSLFSLISYVALIGFI